MVTEKGDRTLNTSPEDQRGAHLENQDYMRRAIELAKKGEGWCHPNPMVGAVIVKDGRIIGEGYHERYGEFHAERNAIKNLTESPEGASIYVTLEPCCHHGKQPPCTEAIVSSGIKKVFIGSRDPNPLVSGKGTAYLRDHGVEVIEDFLRGECDELNPVFFHYITTKRPYVTMKYAMTMDGKIATKTGRSKWITGEEARKEVQKMRHAAMGIMVGIGTVLADDPLLNCRLENGRSPVRIICDSRLRIPMDSQIVRTAKEYKTIVVSGFQGFPDGESSLNEKMGELLDAGIQIVNCPKREFEKAGRKNESDNFSEINLKGLMDILGENGIDSMLLEGGGRLNESALNAGIVNEIYTFVAPKIFGGEARSPVCGEGVTDPGDAYKFSLLSVDKIGDDVLLRYRSNTES